MNHHVAVLMLCALAVTGSARADDLYPPSWRGDEGTTFALWEFSTANPAPAADQEDNPYGSPAMTIWTGVGQTWWEMWEGRQGVWPLSGALEAEVPNRADPLSYKDIWVQITWRSEVPSPLLLVRELDTGVIGSLVNQVVLDDGWTHSTYQIHLEPNPPAETIRVDGSVMVDEVVVDTICIPEPMTMALLAVGTGVLVLRRKYA